MNDYKDDIKQQINNSISVKQNVLGSNVKDIEDVVNTIKYSGYVAKLRRQLANQAHLDHLEIPADLRYDEYPALSLEAREKLTRMRPATLGQAGRIDGVRAGDLALLTVILRRDRRRTDDEGRET